MALTECLVLASDQWLSWPHVPSLCLSGDPGSALLSISCGHRLGASERQAGLWHREELAPAYNALVPALRPSTPWPHSICPHNVLWCLPTPLLESWAWRWGGHSLLEPREERVGNPQACGGGDKQERVKGLGPLAFDGAALRGASPPPSSFRCSSAPQLAPNRKHNTHFTGRGCA